MGVFGLLLGAVFVLFPLTAIAAAGAAPAAETPRAIVEGMVDQLGKAVHGHQAGLQRDPDQLIERVVMPHFAINFTALLVLGSHATTATPAQRVAFERAFHDALRHSFAKGLIDFMQVNVKVLPAAAHALQNHALVRTEVLQSDGSTVAVDYAFRKNAAGEWKVYDVIVEGISYMALYRSQVNSQIDKEGIDSVISRLRTKGLIDMGS